MLGDAEVDEDGAALTVDHYVAGLDVEVEAACGVDVAESAGGLADVIEGFGFAQGTAYALEAVGEGFAVDVVHHIVGCAVFFKHISDFDNAGMVHAALGLRFGYEFAVELVNELLARADAHGDGAGGITVAVVGDEKLLDGHGLLEHDVARQISAAETALGQKTLYAVGAEMERCPGGECGYVVVVHDVCDVMVYRLGISSSF